MAHPQLVGDRDVPAGVPEPDRRGHEQRPPAAAERTGPGNRPWLRGERVDEVADQQVRPDRLPHRRSVPTAADRHQVAPGPAGHGHAGLVRHHRILVAVHDEDRAAHLPADRLRVLGGGRVKSRSGAQQRLGIGVEAPPEAVLALLVRVRLGEHLRHEELDPTAVVGQPVVAVGLLPAPVARPWLVEAGRDRPGQRGTDRDDPDSPVRVPGGELQRVPPAHRQPADHRAVGRGRVHHRDRVLHVLTVGVGLRGGRTVGPSVAAALDRDHPEVPGQVGHLRLPLPGVHDGPRGQQDDRRLPRSEDLVADLDPVALDDALVIRQPCPHDAAFRPTRLHAPWSSAA